jgi:hypothetical protein
MNILAPKCSAENLALAKWGDENGWRAVSWDSECPTGTIHTPAPSQELERLYREKLSYKSCQPPGLGDKIPTSLTDPYMKCVLANRRELQAAPSPV